MFNRLGRDLARLFGRDGASDDDHGSTRRALPPGDVSLLIPPTRVEELVSTVRRIHELLESHDADFTDVRAQLGTIGRLGETATELRRQGATMNETLAEHADRSRRSSESSQALTQRIGDSLVGQADAVMAMQQQVDALVRTLGGLSEDLDRLRISLAEVSGHGAKSSTALVALAESQSRRELESWARTRVAQRVIIALLSITTLCAIVAAAGAAVVGWVALSGTSAS